MVLGVLTTIAKFLAVGEQIVSSVRGIVAVTEGPPGSGVDARALQKFLDDRFAAVQRKISAEADRVIVALSRELDSLIKKLSTDKYEVAERAYRRALANAQEGKSKPQDWEAARSKLADAEAALDDLPEFAILWAIVVRLQVEVAIRVEDSLQPVLSVAMEHCRQRLAKLHQDQTARGVLLGLHEGVSRIDIYDHRNTQEEFPKGAGGSSFVIGNGVALPATLAKANVKLKELREQWLRDIGEQQVLAMLLSWLTTVQAYGLE